MTFDLPLVAASPLLEWQPGETFFSLCSRHHQFWGYSTSGQSAEILFGGRRVGTHHDLPSALDAFVLRTEGRLGTADQLARNRTLLRYYRPFVSAKEVDSAVGVMRGPTVAHLKFRLGLLTSRFRANHPLKACASCMQADQVRSGWVYWHMQHQYPGVWVCPWHREPLLLSTVKSNGVERFLWALPAEHSASKHWAKISSESEQSLGDLTDLTVGLVERAAEDGWLNPPAVQATLRAGMAAQGWLTAGGSARTAEAAVSYLEHCARLRDAPELGGLPANVEEAKTQVGHIARPFRAGTHPLRLLVAIHWLFGGSDEFLTAHLSALRQEPPGIAVGNGADKPTGPAATQEARRRLLVEFLEGGASATAAAQRVGVDVGTAMAWAAAAGIGVGRRPKLLKPEIRESLVRDLREGVDKIDAAGRHGISIETVTKVLRTEVGLHEAWIASRFSDAQRHARKAWLDIFEHQHHAGIKIMRAMNPAAYAWLYRNDREWLKTHSPSGRVASSAARGSGVRWDERDASLSSAVQRAALELSRSHPGKPLLLWQFYQAVPELKPKLSALSRLPLTKRVLELVLGRRSTSVGSGDLLSS
jgi:hypothetical protein